VAFFLVATSLAAQTKPSAPGRRPLTVEDTIQMTRLADPDYFSGGDSKAHVALFSPDGNRFVVMLRNGNLEQNTNEYSLLLYRTADALKSPKPEVLVKMSSSSNRDAISEVRWLRDNETLVFLCENPGELTQVHSLNIRSRRVKKLTNHSTAITKYDITADGHKILFFADTPAKSLRNLAQARRDGMVVTDQALPDLLAGNCAASIYCIQQQLFLQKGQQPPIRIPVKDLALADDPLSFSPDGNYAVVGVNMFAEDMPKVWSEYTFPQNEYLHRFFTGAKGSAPFGRYLLVDTERGSTEPFWNAPMIQFEPFTWASHGDSVFMRAYLPLESADPAERAAREQNKYPVEVRFPTREFRKVTEEEFSIDKSAEAPLEVTLQENLNVPPKIFVSDPRTHRTEPLIDLNPQFRGLNLGNVETFEWKGAGGIELLGGLYLPPDYETGKRYPLVIQTHGFNSGRFSMDGQNEWSSGYAARSLAAKGIVVLQTYKLKNTNDGDLIGSDGHLGANPAQAHKKFAVTAYEDAIDYLDHRGLVDPSRVGIMGFSRTVCFAADALTHSKYQFASAILVDGIDCGYFTYLVFEGAPDLGDLNGGRPPFGENLNVWLREAPGFNLDKVHTPVRLEAHGASSGVLELWEWFSGLSRLAKPVEYIYLPDAPHLLVKPWERRTSQQGAVDWFCFWLKGEEDPDPAKAEQYARWRELRKLQQASEAGSKPN
jgi:dipeptidyl aminopeptidase/acylaminoacyl peptidase